MIDEQKLLEDIGMMLSRDAVCVRNVKLKDTLAWYAGRQSAFEFVLSKIKLAQIAEDVKQIEEK